MGISGSGMAPLAELALLSGISVSGSDIRESRGSARLLSLGVPIDFFHTDARVGGADAVIYSHAVPRDAPELRYARAHGIPTFSRAELLGALSLRSTFRIGISGSHGKSTTVAMTERIFSLAGLSPTVVSGAALCSGEALLFGKRDLFIFEACEYRDSFLATRPTAAVILNAELDHTDYFKSERQLERSFYEFARGARDMAIVNIDTPLSASVYSRLGGRATSLGRAAYADFRYTPGGNSDAAFALEYRGRPLGLFSLNTLGTHFIADAAAAAAVAYLHGVRVDTVREALASFSGIERRLELLCNIGGRSIFYDYAHHPTEIAAVISAVRQKYGKCTVIFKPHTYSRTASLWEGFVSSLRLADHAVLLDIYAAREGEIPGISSSLLAEAVGPRARHLPDPLAVEYTLQQTEGAVILMGAGEVDKIKNIFLKLGE